MEMHLQLTQLVLQAENDSSMEVAKHSDNGYVSTARHPSCNSWVPVGLVFVYLLSQH